MRIGFKKRTSGQIEFGIIYGGISLAGLLSARLLPVARLLPSCLIKEFFGFPCPTCGATRSVVRLSYGDLRGSFAANPLVSLALVSTVIFFLWSVASLIMGLPRIELVLSEREKNRMRAGVILLVVANWLYLVRAGL